MGQCGAEATRSLGLQNPFSMPKLTNSSLQTGKQAYTHSTLTRKRGGSDEAKRQGAMVNCGRGKRQAP
jgi:hypothetical protein